MATQTTGQQRRQQVPWNPQKHYADKGNVVAMVEDVKLPEPQHCTAGHHLSDVSQHSNMTYSIIKRPNKHKDIETTSKRSRYMLDENIRNTQPNSSALWIP